MYHWSCMNKPYESETAIFTESRCREESQLCSALYDDIVNMYKITSQGRIFIGSVDGIFG